MAHDPIRNVTNERQMLGFFAGLTDEQKKQALAYRGEENHGDMQAKPEIIKARNAVTAVLDVKLGDMPEWKSFRALERAIASGDRMNWQVKILNEPRLGFVKEHGSKRRPVKR